MDRDVYRLPCGRIRCFDRGVLAAIHDLGVRLRKGVGIRAGRDQAVVTRALAPLNHSFTRRHADA